MRKILCLAFFLFLTTPALAIEVYRANRIAVVYKSPSKNSTIIYRFQSGEEFKVISKEKGGWLKVRFSSRILGYVQEAEATPIFSRAGGSEENKHSKSPSRSVALLSLGEWARWNGLAVSVARYETVSKCRGYGEGPAEGAKLVSIWIAVHNESEDVIELPSFYVELDGVEKTRVGLGA